MIPKNCFVCNHKRFMSAFTAVCGNEKSPHFAGKGYFTMSNCDEKLINWEMTCEHFENIPGVDDYGMISISAPINHFNKVSEDSEFILNQSPLLDTPIKLIKADKSENNNEPSHAEPLYMGAGRWFIPEGIK